MRRRRNRRTARAWTAGLLLGRPVRRIELGVALLVGGRACGTAGYVLVGLPLFDAFYQTAITVSTVGYGEIGPEGEVDRAYRVVTLLLVFGGSLGALRINQAAVDAARPPVRLVAHT